MSLGRTSKERCNERVWRGCPGVVCGEKEDGGRVDERVRRYGAKEEKVDGLNGKSIMRI
jgi:hypothetical protein